MWKQAGIEAKRREEYIKHHFEVSHLSSDERNRLGFVGEFACCTALGIDWHQNIRKDYYTIDDRDLVIREKKVDVKTETIPAATAPKIINGTIRDNEPYGCRLVNEKQRVLLPKYDLVIFGFCIRETKDYWYPIGYIEASLIYSKYPPTLDTPYGSHYSQSACRVPTSVLKPIEELL